MRFGVCSDRTCDCWSSGQRVQYILDSAVVERSLLTPEFYVYGHGDSLSQKGSGKELDRRQKEEAQLLREFVRQPVQTDGLGGREGCRRGVHAQPRVAILMMFHILPTSSRYTQAEFSACEFLR